MSAEAWVERLEDGVEAVIKWTVVTILGLLCVNVFVQVILRYVFLYSSRWTLEISRYMMIWAVLLAAGPALKRGFLVGIDMLVERMKPSTRLWITCLLRVVMGVLAGTILVQALKLIRTQFEMDQLSPALELPMAYFSIALPVGFTVFLFFLITMTCKDLLRARRG